MKKTALIASMAVFVLAGCAGMGGPSDEELIMQTVTLMKESLLAGDAETLLAQFSEDFSHYEVPDKETLADYVEMGVDMGYLDQLEEQNAEILLEDAEVVIDGDTATVYPIDASADMGSVTLELTLKKEEDGVWRIIGADVEGI